jgi:hypothetical protein
MDKKAIPASPRCESCVNGRRVRPDEVRVTVGALGKPRPCPHLIQCNVGALPAIKLPGDTCERWA